MHLAFETLIRIPGVSLEVTFPGSNVLNTANMNAILAGGRPAWWAPVTIALALLCAACLTATIGVSASIAARALRPAAVGDTPPTPAPATPAATSTALEVRTAVDPWAVPEGTTARQ